MAFLDNVRTQVREVQWTRLAVSALLLLPYVVGWLCGKAMVGLTLVLYALGWFAGRVCLSVRVGWQDSGMGNGPDKAGRT